MTDHQVVGKIMMIILHTWELIKIGAAWMRLPEPTFIAWCSGGIHDDEREAYPASIQHI